MRLGGGRERDLCALEVGLGAASGACAAGRGRRCAPRAALCSAARMAAAVAPAARRADSTRTEGADVSQCAQGGVERQKVAGAAAYAEGRFADAAGAFAAAHAAAREARLPARQRASLASNAAAASLRAGDAGRAADMARAAAQDDGSWAKVRRCASEGRAEAATFVALVAHLRVLLPSSRV